MDMKNVKGVIFDMDGVIIDTENIWKQAEKEFFSSLGVQMPEEYTKVTQFWYEKNI